MKKLLLIALLAIMVFTLFACTDTAATSEATADVATEESATSEASSVALTTVSCESFSAGYPAGWTNLPYEDMFAEEEGTLDPDGLEFVKGEAEDEFDALMLANVIITWCEPGTSTMDARDMYDNVEDVSLTAGGREWTGFTGDFGSAKNIWLMCSDDEGLWQVSGMMSGESDDMSYTVDSEDFIAILASITLN